ncbi:MAG: serine hydrolase [Rhodospirillaceae bacterium]|nr:serine hydrolase [Rhodospirillaceae bacterium]
MAAGPAPDGLPRARPEDEGVDPWAVIALLDDLKAANLELHSFMLARQGRVVVEGWWRPYGRERKHMMHSLTKSVTACGVGLALVEKRFALTDKVVSFFPQHLPARVSPNLEAMTVEHLLTMRTGHAVETSGAAWRPIPTSWVAEFFKIPVVNAPGSAFLYTSAATYMLSAIITKTTGQRLRDYLEPRLLAPLGIADVGWDIGPENINPGANGLSWRTADTLKLALLHAQGGAWNGRQLLPREWVAAATRRQSGNDEYGYQWWVGPGDIYYALGKYCQVGMVFPEHDAVLSITAASDKNSPILDRIWKYFPKGFGPSKSLSAVLEQRLNTLSVLPDLPRTSSPLETQLSNAAFTAAPNEDGIKSMNFQISGNLCRFTLTDARGTHGIVAGLGDWVEGVTSMSGAPLHHEYESTDMPVVAGAKWTNPNTLEMIWQFAESAFRDTVICRFDGDNLTFDRSANVASGGSPRPTVRARRI